MTRGFSADLRLAARSLLASPLFTIFAVLSLAVGVGVTTAVYSVVDAVFLKTPGVHEPGRVVFVVTPYDGRFLKGSLSQTEFEHLRAAQTVFSSVSASTSFYPAVVTPSGTELLSVEAVDGAYFSTLGVPVVLGRTIQPEDHEAGAKVVVLSHGLWRVRFAANPAVVGRTIRVAGQPLEVIGVAAPAFEGASGLLRGTRLWIPLAAAFGSPHATDDRRGLIVFGRLRSSATVASASAQLAAIASSLERTVEPRTRADRVDPQARRWKGKSVEAVVEEDSLLRRVGLTLIALVGLVLLVACTNLANLVLARATTRRQELAIRSALGASRWRLVRGQCAESLLLAIPGAIASYVVFQGIRALIDVEFNVGLPMGGRVTLVIQPTLDLGALAVAGTSLLLALVVFGLEPALLLTRGLREELAATAGGVGASLAKRQRTLLRWQVAISAGFFVIATMFVKHTIAEVRHDSGVQMERFGVAVLNFHTQQWDEGRVRRMVDRVLDELQKDPAVVTASVSTAMPFGLSNPMGLSLSIPEDVAGRADAGHAAFGIGATPPIFSTIGVPIVRGRAFDERDRTGAPPVAVLSELTARTLFGTTDVVGRSVALRSRKSNVVVATVIGLSRDTDVGRLLHKPRLLVYLPLAQRFDPLLAIAVRSSTAVGGVRALREALRRADPDLAVERIGTGREVLAGPYVFLRAAGMSALALGGLTLLLAMVGLFGIQSHHVAHRTREIGVRMSLGATVAHIRWMVLKEGYRPVLDGLVLGLFMGLAGRMIVRAYVEADVNVVDPWMLLVVPLPVFLSAVCACYLPARRASRVDPSRALRV